MSVNENDFEDIFEAISEILKFLNLADQGSLENNQMTGLFRNAFYVERLAGGIVSRGLGNAFESSLNEYLRKGGKVVHVSCDELTTLGDEVLKRVLTVGEEVEVAVEEYLKVAGGPRLEAVVGRLSEAREIYQRLAGCSKLPEDEVAASFLAQAWLRLCDSGEEDRVRVAVEKMLADSTTACPLTAILALSSTPDILHLQTLLLDVISTHISATPTSPTWMDILQSQQLIEIIEKFPYIFDLIKPTFIFMETVYKFDFDNNIWYSSSSSDIEYSVFFGIIKRLYSFKVTHFKLKSFLYSRKHKGPFLFWDHILSELASLTLGT